MKKIIQITIITISFVCFSFLSLYTQTTTKEKKDTYKVWVTKMDKSSKTKGYLTEIADSAVIVTNLSTSDSQIVNVNVMDEIKFKKKGNLGRGALVGFTIGALLGLTPGGDTDCSIGVPCFSTKQKVLVGGFAGAIIGGIIGNKSEITIPIKGSQKAYNKQKEKLKKYQLSF